MPAGMTVDINSASVVELGHVRFIGRKRAVAIVAGRPWQTPEDLVAKRIVPRKYYDQIKDHLVAK
jgi:DNA uptake protein ComE-like DNA-binding protein